MKILVLFCCALAVASAGYSPYAYHGPQHIPIITHEGVPLETPEVQAAKANHLAAVAAAYSGYAVAPVAYATHGAPYIAHGIPAVAHNGQPLDTPEVAAAKAHHFAAYNEAAARNGAHGFYGAPYAVTSAGPVDTPEVQHAKAAHFAAHAEASARAGHPFAHLRKRRDLYAYGQHIPVIGPNGVPVDTPEVQHAKAAHFAAHAEAASRAHGVYSPVVYGGVYGGHYGHYGYAAIGPDGHPVETPEVQAAKAAHFAAHAHARTGGYYPTAHAYPYHVPLIAPNGVPVDTPEVQAAKAHHFAAHAAAAHNNYY